jgi:hypothetical protein
MTRIIYNMPDKSVITTTKIVEPPKPVGHWVLYAQANPQTRFTVYYKPTPEQIENTQKLLGWTWEDAK